MMTQWAVMTDDIQSLTILLLIIDDVGYNADDIDLIFIDDIEGIDPHYYWLLVFVREEAMMMTSDR